MLKAQGESENYNPSNQGLQALKNCTTRRSSNMRVFLLLLLLGVFIAAPNLILGERYNQAMLDWMKVTGSWAWLAGIGLIVADLVIPVPATTVSAALGLIYGTIVGGLLASIGIFAAGTVAYTLSRLLGLRAALRLVGRRDLKSTAAFFERNGIWAVALSRGLPLLPEAISCLAGLAHMPVRRYLLALMCGSLPVGFVFATLGAMLDQQPLLGLLISAFAPLVAAPLVACLLSRQSRSVGKRQRK